MLSIDLMRGTDIKFYRATTGRFTSEDPVRDGLNWYTYANNNPVMLYDPSGLASVNLIENAGAMGAT